MSNCKNKSGQCGCSGGSPLTTPACSCNPSESCNTESCAELFKNECIIHSQPEMLVIRSGQAVSITENMRLNVIIQKLMVHYSSSLAAYAPSDFKVLAKTDTTITVAWLADATVTYQVSWAEYVDGDDISAVVFNDTSPATLGISSYTISDLESDTQYLIFVSDVDESADSVILKLKTN